jgi:hypothetical protein
MVICTTPEGAYLLLVRSLPQDLKEMAEKFHEKRKAGQAYAHGSGYGGSGFKFDASEENLVKQKKKVRAWFRMKKQRRRRRRRRPHVQFFSGSLLASAVQGMLPAQPQAQIVAPSTSPSEAQVLLLCPSKSDAGHALPEMSIAPPATTCVRGPPKLPSCATCAANRQGARHCGGV